MSTYEYCLFTLLFMELFISAFTDIVYGKIKNIVVLCFALLALPIQVWGGIIGYFNIIDYALNFCLVVVFAIVLHMGGMWAAGDCKLLMSIATIFPYTRYWNINIKVFKSLSLILVFIAVIYFYVIIDTIVNAVTNVNALFLTLRRTVTVDAFITFVKRWFIVIAISSFVTQINNTVLQWSYASVAVIIFCIFMLAGNLINKMGSFWLFAIIYDVSYYYFCKIQVGILIISVISATLLWGLSRVIQVFNYKIIERDDLKKGMIISALCIEELQMITGSKLLCEKMGENIAARLTEEEVDYVRKIEIDRIRIVRKISFAFFVLISCILYLFMEMYYAGNINRLYRG